MRLLLWPSAVLALLLAPLAAPLGAQTPDGSATLVSIEGSVELVAPSGTVPARPPVRLAPGTRVKTGANSSALLVLDNGSKLRVRADSDFEFKDGGPAGFSVSLLRGVLSCWIHKLGDRRLRVLAPGAVAAVRGTVFDVRAMNGSAFFDLFEGELVITDHFGRGLRLFANHRLRVSAKLGFRGTSLLPRGAHARPEPVAFLPPPPQANAQAKNAPPPPAPAAAAPPPSTINSEPPPAAAFGAQQPPPPPQQTQTVAPPVSPSSPGPNGTTGTTGPPP